MYGPCIPGIYYFGWYLWLDFLALFHATMRNTLGWSLHPRTSFIGAKRSLALLILIFNHFGVHAKPWVCNLRQPVTATAPFLKYSETAFRIRHNSLTYRNRSISDFSCCGSSREESAIPTFDHSFHNVWLECVVCVLIELMVYVA